MVFFCKHLITNIMNKIKPLLLLVALLVGTQATCQTSKIIIEPTPDDQSTRTILRTRADGEVLNCKSGGGRTVFSLCTDLPYAVEGEIEYVEVYDFVVDNDSVFFCGMDVSLGDYAAGYFDIDDFFAGTGAVGLLNNIGFSVTDMVSYTDSQNTRHIMCVGGGNMVVDIYYGGNSWYVDAFECSDDRLSDITIADGYVVAAGIYDNSSNANAYADQYYPVMRVFSKDAPFSITSPCRTSHRFNDLSNYGNRMWVSYDKAVVVGLPGTNTVTLASTVINIPEENPCSSFVTRSHFAQISIPMLVANNSAAMIAAMEIDHASIQIGSSVVDVIWDDVMQSYIAVRGSGLSSPHPGCSFFFELPYSVWYMGGSVHTVFDSTPANVMWQGVAIYDQATQYRYRASGISYVNLAPMRCKYAEWAVGSLNQCFSSADVNTMTVSTVGVENVQAGSFYTSGSISPETVYNLRRDNNLEEECSD